LGFPTPPLRRRIVWMPPPSRSSGGKSRLLTGVVELEERGIACFA